MHVHWRLLCWIALGQVPGIYAGFWLLNYLHEGHLWTLELILALFITFGGMSMAIRPRTFAKVSGPVTASISGMAGGLSGGLFAAGGPVIGWFGYCQPLPLAVIRSTLLSSFLLATCTRTIFVGAEGGLTNQVLIYAGLAVPIVMLGVWLGRAFPPIVAEAALKRGAFSLLMLMGLWMCFSLFFIQN